MKEDYQKGNLLFAYLFQKIIKKPTKIKKIVKIKVNKIKKVAPNLLKNIIKVAPNFIINTLKVAPNLLKVIEKKDR
ncbi:MAG: hypothetical protein ACI4U5_02360 [Bacilli bacterium]